MKIKLIGIVIGLCTALALISCNREPSMEGIAINQYGGTGRTNCYENFGNFYSVLVMTDIPKAKDSSGAINTPLALSSANIIIPTAAGSIVSLYKDSTEWEYILDKNTVVTCGMATDENHDIYALSNDGTLYSLTSGGALRWKNKIFEKKEVLTTFSDLLAVKDGVVAAMSNGEIKKISFDGKVLWTIQKSLGTTQFFPADNKGNLAIPLTNEKYGATDSLMLVNKDGKILWQIAFDSFRITKSPVMFDGKIYLIGLKENDGNKISTVFALDHSGKIKWKLEINMHVRYISVAGDGRLYLTGYNTGIGEAFSGIYCVDTKGKVIWSKFYEVAITNPVMVGKKRLAFLGSDNNSQGMYFLNKNGNPEEMVSLADTYLLRFQPVVTPGSTIILAGAERLMVVRLDDMQLNKILPW